MESWGHFENRSKAALGNKKARFHCARLHMHCSHVMRLYCTNLIINNLKERTNHGKTIETSLARDPNPLWRGRSQIHEENGDSLPISRNWQTKRTPSGNTSICTSVPSRKASVPSVR